MRNKKRSGNIILCQPDDKKGCSACCGILNFNNLSKNNLTGFLNAFEKRRDIKAKKDVFWAEQFGIRDKTSHVCPYQGFIGKGKPGCMAHSKINGKCMRKKSIFGSRVCNDYLCPAHSILDDEYKQILVDYIDDWYLYTVSISDPESFIWIVELLNKYSSFNLLDIDLKKNKRIKNALHSAVKIHAGFLKKNKTPIFQYSISEYNHAKHLFTVNSKLESAARCRESIISAVEKILTI
jgi:hypothetical protein